MCGRGGGGHDVFGSMPCGMSVIPDKITDSLPYCK